MSGKSELKKETLSFFESEKAEADLGLLKSLGPQPLKLKKQDETQIAAFERHRVYIKSLDASRFFESDGRLSSEVLGFAHPGYYLDVVLKGTLARLLRGSTEELLTFLDKNKKYIEPIAKDMFRLMKTGRGLEKAFLLYERIVSITGAEPKTYFKQAFQEVMGRIIASHRLVECINRNPRVSIDEVLSALNPALRESAIAQIMEDPAAIVHCRVGSFKRFMEIFESSPALIDAALAKNNKFVLSLESVAELTQLCARFPKYQQCLMDTILYQQSQNHQPSLFSKLFHRATAKDIEQFFHLCDSTQREETINLIFNSSTFATSSNFLIDNLELTTAFLRVAKRILGEEGVKEKINQSSILTNWLSHYGSWLKVLRDAEFSRAEEMAAELRPPEKTSVDFASFLDSFATPQAAAAAVLQNPKYLHRVFNNMELFKLFAQNPEIKKSIATFLSKHPEFLIDFLKDEQQWKTFSEILPNVVFRGLGLLERNPELFAEKTNTVDKLERFIRTVPETRQKVLMDKFFENSGHQVKVFSSMNEFVKFCKVLKPYEHQARKALFNQEVLARQLLKTSEDLQKFCSINFEGPNRYQGEYNIFRGDIHQEARGLYQKNQSSGPDPVSDGESATPEVPLKPRSDEKHRRPSVRASSSSYAEFHRIAELASNSNLAAPQLPGSAMEEKSSQKPKPVTTLPPPGSLIDLGEPGLEGLPIFANALPGEAAASQDLMDEDEAETLGLEEDNPLPDFGIPRSVAFFNGRDDQRSSMLPGSLDDASHSSAKPAAGKK